MEIVLGKTNTEKLAARSSSGESFPPMKKTIPLVNKVEAIYDILTGEGVLKVQDVLVRNSNFEIPIEHYYKKNYKIYNCGKNFRLNLHERLEKNSSSGTSDADYIYTDAAGDTYSFKDRYYYVNNNDERVYINDKSKITVELDGKLTYFDSSSSKNYTVKKEQRTLSGWIATTKIEGFKNSELIELRIDEQKQIEQQILNCRSVLEEMTIFNMDSPENATFSNLLPSYEDSIFNDFKYTSSMIAHKSDVMQYMSAKRQDAYLKEYSSPEIHPAGGYTAKAISNLKSSLYEMKLRLKSYVNNTSANGNASIQACIDNINYNLDNDLMISSEDYNIFQDGSLYNTGYDQQKVYGKEAKELFRQRNLVLEQLSTTQTDIGTQKKLLSGQLFCIKSKQETNSLLAQQYYKEYINLQFQLTQLKRQIPVNYLTNGEIIKGFNEEGNLVAIYDNYNNCFIIEYDEKGKIIRVLDDQDRKVTFTYDKNNRISLIVDTRGGRTEYKYNSDGYLTEVDFANGKTIEFTYDANENISNVKTSDFEEVLIDADDKLKNITIKTYANKIKNGKVETTTNAVSIGWIQFSYDTDCNIIEYDSGKKEYYQFIDSGLISCCEEEDGKIVKAELHSYEAYTQHNIVYASKDSLYCKSYSEFGENDYLNGDWENITLGDFNNPVKIERNEREMSSNSTEQVTTTYEYNDEHKCIKEISVVTETLPVRIKKKYERITEYRYDSQGRQVRTESYTRKLNATTGELEEDESVTLGRSVEETEYDEHGNAVRKYSYNSLDTGTKFYTESDYAENGQVLADYDETGENKTEYEYIFGTNIVRTQKLPNGSKFAYGYDSDDTVTSITQSTEEGEENGTRKQYTCGVITELQSGNNRVGYEYDHKRRVTKVSLNGTENYARYAYTENTSVNNISADKTEITNAKGERFARYTDKHGRVLQTDYNGVAQLVYTYEKDKLKSVQDKAVDETHAYEYDSLGRQTKHTYGANSTTDVYDEYSQTKTRTSVCGTDTATYAYTYGSDSRRALTETNINVQSGTIKERLSYDAQGRVKTAERSTDGRYTLTERYEYGKTGDHATNRIAAIYYGKNGVTDGKATYTYDGMGNIVSVNENGKQQYKYAYDSLGRLVSEKNLYKGKEVCYTYDNNGNILTKSIDGEIRQYKYKEGTDRLMSYNGELCEYDAAGNPTKYRNLNCVWNKGRQLTKLTDGENSVEYTYDGSGLRRTKTSGGITKTYVYENGKLMRESGGEEPVRFLYGEGGIIGIKYDRSKFLFRKNVFGDVTEVYNVSGELVAKYSYSAFGECTIEYNKDNAAHINPIRYRGYYYDEETGLYYLNSRYYDPETGRFLNADDITYLDPETINGLNLYAYCGNNPVMNVDPNGTFLLALFLILGAFTVAGGIIGGKVSYDNAVAAGKTGADLFWTTLKGSVIGAAFGLAVGGAVIMLGAVGAGALSAVGIGAGTFFGVSALQSFAIGALAFDFTAFVVAPILGISMEGVELDWKPTVIQKPGRTPKHPAIEKLFLDLNNLQFYNKNYFKNIL